MYGVSHCCNIPSQREKMNFIPEDELNRMGFASLGQGVKLSRHASLHGISRISIGDNSRIDDFAVLSAGKGGIFIGRHVHVAVFCSLIGKGRIELHDFANLSGRTSIYSSSDDFSGVHMTNPTIPAEYLGVVSEPVIVGKHCVVGSGSVLLPGTVMREGSTVGALSLAKGELEEFTMYAGIPAKSIRARKRDLLAKEAEFRDR